MTTPKDTAPPADPMDRLAIAEARLESEQAERKKLEATVAELQQTVQAYQDSEAKRRKDAQVGYLDSLQQKATKAQSPIPAEDLKRIEAAFERGDEETAHVLGQAFLDRSIALGGSGSNGGSVSSLMAAGDPDKVFGQDPDPERGRKALLAEAGFDEDDKSRPSGRKWR